MSTDRKELIIGWVWLIISIVAIFVMLTSGCSTNQDESGADTSWFDVIVWMVALTSCASFIFAFVYWWDDYGPK